MLVQHIFVPYATSNEIFLIAALPLLWSMVSFLVLHLAITLESIGFNIAG